MSRGKSRYGYTLLAGSDSLSINKTLFPKLGFDVTGFAPVAQGVRVPQILVVRADSPARSFAESVELARRGAIAVGTPGNGSLAHLLGEQIQGAAEIRGPEVPYKGGALAVNDLLGGTLQGVLINIGGATDHVRGRSDARPVCLLRRADRGAAQGADPGRGRHAGGRQAVGWGWHRPTCRN